MAKLDTQFSSTGRAQLAIVQKHYPSAFSIDELPQSFFLAFRIGGVPSDRDAWVIKDHEGAVVTYAWLDDMGKLEFVPNKTEAINYREIKLLTIAEVENIIISAIEDNGNEQDPVMNPIYQALKKLANLAKERHENS